MIDEAQGSGAGEIPDTRACESHEASASPARSVARDEGAVSATRVRRGTPTAERIAHYTDRSGGPDACWLWTGYRSRFGYGKLGMRGADGSRQVCVRAHRVAYELAHGPIPEGLCVLHRCDTPACVNPAHLALGTQADNMRDMIAKGRGNSRPPSTPGRPRPDQLARGSRVAGAKLSDEAVREIRARAHEGVLHREIAALHGVSRSSVGRIVARESWAHVA